MREQQHMRLVWTPVRKLPLRCRKSVLFDSSDEAQRMASYEKANAAEVHKCLNLLFKKRREEGHTARSENKASGVVNRVAQAVSGSNGNGHEPFVMPRPLSERVAASPELASQPVAARPENRPVPTGPDVSTPEASACSAEAAAVATASAGGMPAQT